MMFKIGDKVRRKEGRGNVCTIYQIDEMSEQRAAYLENFFGDVEGVNYSRQLLHFDTTTIDGKRVKVGPANAIDYELVTDGEE